MENDERQALLLSQAANYVWDNGIYLNERTADNFRIKLYLCDEKYFEFYHLQENEERVLKIAEINLEEVLTLYGHKTNWPETQKILHK